MSGATLERGAIVPARRFGPFDAAQVAAYAAASGDDNPLHHDASIAARAGLARPPVHGMLLMAQFEPWLRDWIPALAIEKLSAKFVRPLLVDEACEASGKVVQAAPGAPAVMRLMVKTEGGDIVCLAEAVVSHV